MQKKIFEITLIVWLFPCKIKELGVLLMKKFLHSQKPALPYLIAAFLFVFLGQWTIAMASRGNTNTLSALILIQGFFFGFTYILSKFSDILLKKNDYLLPVLTFNGLIGGIFWLIFRFFGQYILLILYAYDNDWWRNATNYFRAMSPFVFLGLLIISFIKVLLRKNKWLQVLVVAVLSAIFQNRLTHFYLFQRFRGITHVGYAHVYSLIFMLVLVIIVAKNDIPLDFSDFFAKIKKTFTYSFKSMVQELLQGFFFIFFINGMVARLGSRDLFGVYALILAAFFIARLPSLVYSFLLPKYPDEYFFSNGLQISIGFYLIISLVFFAYPLDYIHHFTINNYVLSRFPLYINVAMLYFIATPVMDLYKFRLKVLGQNKFVMLATIIVNFIFIGVLFYLKNAYNINFIGYLGVFGLNNLLLMILFVLKLKKVS